MLIPSLLAFSTSRNTAIGRRNSHHHCDQQIVKTSTFLLHRQNNICKLTVSSTSSNDATANKNYDDDGDGSYYGFYSDENSNSDEEEFHEELMAYEEDLTYRTNLRIRNLVTKSIQDNNMELAWEAERMLLKMEDAYDVWDKKSSSSSSEEDEDEIEEWKDVVWGSSIDDESDDESDGGENEDINAKKDTVMELGPPDTVTYNMVINAYAKSSEEGSSRHAERILERMESLHQYQKECYEYWEQHLQEEQYAPPRFNVKPNVRTYSTVIDAWARNADSIPSTSSTPSFYYKTDKETGDLSAAHRAESILHKLNTLYLETKDASLRPNVITYNTVLNAWSKQQSQQQPGDDNDVAAKRATELLSHMESPDVYVSPDVISYNTVMSAWSRCFIDGGEKAEEILRRMIQNADEARAENKRRAEQGDEDRKKFYMEKKQNKAEVVNQEEEDEETYQNYNSDSNDKKRTRKKRRRRVNLIPVILPNARSYSIVLDAHGKSNHPKSAQRAYSILREMERMNDKRVRPNVVTYSSTINALARSRYVKHKAFKALRLLRRMEDLYFDHDESSNNNAAKNVVKPNAHCYNAVINACAMSFGRLEYHPTDYYSDEQQDEYSEEDDDDDETDELVIGDKIINIRKNPNVDESIIAIQIVKDLYYQMTSDDTHHVKPDHFTYGTILKACANLLPISNTMPSSMPNLEETTWKSTAAIDTTIDPNEKQKKQHHTMSFIREVFEHCCQNGMVSSGVCYQLRQAATSDLYRELMSGVEGVELEHFDSGSASLWTRQSRLEGNIPKEWSRNVRRKEL